MQKIYIDNETGYVCRLDDTGNVLACPINTDNTCDFNEGETLFLDEYEAMSLEEEEIEKHKMIKNLLTTSE